MVIKIMKILSWFSLYWFGYMITFKLWYDLQKEIGKVDLRFCRAMALFSWFGGIGIPFYLYEVMKKQKNRR